MPKIDVQYNYLRKEKKISFKLIQSPLQEQFFISYFNQRYDLETEKLGQASSEIEFLRQESILIYFLLKINKIINKKKYQFQLLFIL